MCKPSRVRTRQHSPRRVPCDLMRGRSEQADEDNLERPAGRFENIRQSVTEAHVNIWVTSEVAFKPAAQHEQVSEPARPRI